MAVPKTQTYTFALQKYMMLQEQHEELCVHLDQMRPRHSSAGSLSTITSPSTSPTRASFSPSPRKHSRSRQHTKAAARCSGWQPETLDTIPDEETLFEISAEEQRLFGVNESIKRALTELLNCDTVRHDIKMRMWVQTRLMETEKELRSGRRKRSTGSE
ncbi:hypothetical protein S40288_01318 [Stachybotrys chartarum IBT 40288]|nr:hypothetical protein S40288_01318 [Stachybotrys chartarum IBT 40288]